VVYPVVELELGGAADNPFVRSARVLSEGVGIVEARLEKGDSDSVSFTDGDDWPWIALTLEVVREVNGIFFITFEDDAFKRFRDDGFSRLKVLLRPQTFKLLHVFEGSPQIQLLHYGRCS